jgi:hypothetical protein
MKELWKRQAQDDVEEFLFTNELVAQSLERVGKSHLIFSHFTFFSLILTFFWVTVQD